MPTKAIEQVPERPSHCSISKLASAEHRCDSANDGTWAFCGDASCGGNTTRSWSGRGFVQINDAMDKSHVGETLTTPAFDTSSLNTVYVQYAWDFKQKGGGAMETFTLEDSATPALYQSIVVNTASTSGGQRELRDVSAIASTTSTYSVQLRYDDLGGQGDYIKIDDLYLYGY